MKILLCIISLILAYLFYDPSRSLGQVFFYSFIFFFFWIIYEDNDKRVNKKYTPLGYLKLYKFPRVLFYNLKKENPHFSDEAILSAFEGLRQFFVSIHSNPNISYGCPSLLVEKAWICFYNHPDYSFFCRNITGRYIAPSRNYLSSCSSPTASTFSNSVKNTWLSQLVSARKPKSLVKLKNGVPYIFSLDSHFANSSQIEGLIIFGDKEIRELKLECSGYKLDEKSGVTITRENVVVYYNGLGGGKGCNYYTSTPQIGISNDDSGSYYYLQVNANPKDYPV